MKIELLGITPNAEELIENAARTCYKSEAKGEIGDLIIKLIKSGHYSVLEHAYATFRISEVSRALTHQLVRHRLCAFSQQSQRYVNEKQFDYVIPDAVYSLKEKNPTIMRDYVVEFKEDMTTIQNMYDKWKAYGLRNEDARSVLPNACYTEIVISANLREFRHIFEVRCDRHAQYEIRKCSLEMLRILNEKAPHIFKDLMEKFNTQEE